MASNVACPCCRFLTLSERGHYELCSVCFWIDGGGDEAPHLTRELPGGLPCLAEARRNYFMFGACQPEAREYVRRPWSYELPVGGPHS